MNCTLSKTHGMLIAGILLTTSTARGSDFLYRNGKEIPLPISPRYSAIQLKPGIVASDAKVTSVFKSDAAGRAMSASAVLRRHRIVLTPSLRLQNLTAANGPAFTSAPFAVGAKAPVYTLGGIDLVLTDEVLYKPTPAAREAVLRRMSAIGKSVATNESGRYLLTVKAGVSSLEIANALAKDAKEIAYAEPNFIAIFPAAPRVTPKPIGPTLLTPMPPNSGEPSDPYFAQQWWLKNRGLGGAKQGADVRAVPAWRAADGTGITIAILDVGVDVTHPDLKDKVVSVYDAISKTAVQQPNTWDGHGTACAGIAAAVTDNAIGVSSIGRNAKIMSVRIGTTPGANQPLITDYQTIAGGIDWAVEHGADVISNSWGGGDDAQVVDDAIDNGLKVGRRGLGVVFVFAAGDDGSSVVWPANLAASRPVIAVGATNEWDELKTRTSKDRESWWASNVGPEVTVVAPGVHLFTTDIVGSGGYAPGDYVNGFNGTSGAAPIVAGVAALLLSKSPGLTAKQVKQKLHDTADTLASASGVGGGRVNACKALGLASCL
jgi:thermitase